MKITKYVSLINENKKGNVRKLRYYILPCLTNSVREFCFAKKYSGLLRSFYGFGMILQVHFHVEKVPIAEVVVALLLRFQGNVYVLRNERHTSLGKSERLACLFTLAAILSRCLSNLATKELLPFCGRGYSLCTDRSIVTGV